MKCNALCLPIGGDSRLCNKEGKVPLDICGPDQRIFHLLKQMSLIMELSDKVRGRIYIYICIHMSASLLVVFML
jgi:hypothetical protein